jgi:hypothetical protein
MRHKRLLTIAILSLASIAGVVLANPATSSALMLRTPVTTVAAITCPSGQVHPKDWNGDIDNSSCCPGTGNPTAMTCLLAKYINPAVNVLAALIGIIVLISIIAAAIQYSSSNGDPGKVAAARQRIFNSLLGLAGFVFIYAFLQWVIPGGL